MAYFNVFRCLLWLALNILVECFLQLSKRVKIFFFIYRFFRVYLLQPGRKKVKMIISEKCTNHRYQLDKFSQSRTYLVYSTLRPEIVHYSTLEALSSRVTILTLFISFKTV